MSADSPPPRPLIWRNVLFIVVLPLLALPAALAWVLTHGVTAAEIVGALVLWWMTGLGITAGYHRLFAHRSYKAAWPVRVWFALVGAMAGENSIIAWCSDHRRHHRHTDTTQDPYNAREGLFHSHIGWILRDGSKADRYDDVPDLWADPICRFQHRWWFVVALVGNVAAVAVVGAFSGRMVGAMLVAGFVRFIVVQHVTFSINSLSHWWGRQPWSTATTSRDNRWLAFLSFGEGYHNFHHTFQADYRNGIHWYDYDPSKWLIRTFAALGLASDLRRTPEHLLLRARFEQGRIQWHARRDALLALGRQPRQGWLRADLAQALADAEIRMEAALGELRARTHAWGEARREGAASTAHELDRRVREATRDAREGLRAWERLARDVSVAQVG